MPPVARSLITTMTVTSIYLSRIFPGDNRLYHNQRNGTFKAITTGAIVNEGANESYSVAWGDFDNDGFPDLFVGNGYGSGEDKSSSNRNSGGTADSGRSPGRHRD